MCQPSDFDVQSLMKGDAQSRRRLLRRRRSATSRARKCPPVPGWTSAERRVDRRPEVFPESVRQSDRRAFQTGLRGFSRKLSPALPAHRRDHAGMARPWSESEAAWQAYGHVQTGIFCEVVSLGLVLRSSGSRVLDDLRLASFVLEEVSQQRRVPSTRAPE